MFKFIYDNYLPIFVIGNAAIIMATPFCPAIIGVYLAPAPFLATNLTAYELVSSLQDSKVDKFLTATFSRGKPAVPPSNPPDATGSLLDYIPAPGFE